MRITLEVTNNKAEFLMELLRSFKFVKVTKTTDWYEVLNDEEKKSIEQGLEDIKNNKVHGHADVMAESRRKVVKRK